MNCAHTNTEVLAVNSPSGSGPIIRCLDCRECWYERLGPPDSPGYDERAAKMREEYLARHRMPFETPANRSSEACEHCRAGIPLHWRGGATTGGLVHTSGERCADQDALKSERQKRSIARDRAAGDRRATGGCPHCGHKGNATMCNCCGRAY